MVTAERYHDFSAGHRVVGHEGACQNLHGHNYRVHFTLAPIAGLDAVGRVLDFGIIKSKLCHWLEDNWDHRMILWSKDPWRPFVEGIDHSVVKVHFNPTAENMAAHLVDVVGPIELAGTGAELVAVKIEETRKCSCTYLKERQ